MTPKAIRGIGIADPHIGIDNVGPPNENGLPARVDDFLGNLSLVAQEAISRKVDLLAIDGDLFKSRNPPQRVLQPVCATLCAVADAGIHVFLVRGNHEGDSEPGRPNVLDTIALLRPKISAFNHPGCLTYPALGLNILAMPWPRLKWALGEMPVGMDYAEMVPMANEGLAHRLLTLTSLRDPALPTLLLGHLAVLGADRSSEQWMTLGYEPTISLADIPLEVDLGLFGHYHKGCEMTWPPNLPIAVGANTEFRPRRAAYCGSIAKIDFGEEGQEKFWWEFEFGGPSGKEVRLEPHLLPDRPFRTLDFTYHEAAPPETVNEAFAAYIWSLNHDLDQAVVRCRLDFGTAQQAAAFSEGAAEERIREAGAWWIAGIERKAPRAIRRQDSNGEISTMGDLDLLRLFLTGQEPDEARLQQLIWQGARVMEGQPALDRGG